MQKAMKWLPADSLKIAEERWKAKCNSQRRKSGQLSTKFQRKTRKKIQ